MNTNNSPQLLAIIELGGYPDFCGLYKSLGYQVVIENSMRKALAYLKNNQPRVIVAEFNYQSAFRDRTSSLESLIAVAQQKPNSNVIVFYDKEFEHQFEKLRVKFPFHAAFSFPINAELLRESLDTLMR